MSHGRSLLVLACLVGGACSGAERPALLEPGAPTPTPGFVGDPVIRPEDGAADPAVDPAVDGEPPAAMPAPPPLTWGPETPDGGASPRPTRDPEVLAALLVEAEKTIRNPTAAASDIADQAHVQQVIYRQWAYEPGWDDAVFTRVPAELRSAVEANLAARRFFLQMRSGVGIADSLPAWEIIEPESAADLLAHYQEAEATTGIEWEYLAAINLVETGMGRIRGLSTAGAQGPMQFIPTTWDEVGEGDVNDPHDAIQAAARYLVRRGGPGNMNQALFGYNNDQLYVDAVAAYAGVLREDPAAFAGFYNWEIYFFTVQGDVWLPVGYRSTEPIALEDYLASSPWSVPADGWYQPDIGD